MIKKGILTYMNKKVIFIFALTIVALAVLYLYSFGPLSGMVASNKFNPASLSPAQTQKVTINSTDKVLNVYHNKDLKENYYTIKIPQDWQVQAGKSIGSYAASFANGNGSFELMDVPDNSTLELFVLSQDEPKLRASLTGYNRTEYKKISVNGNEAYELVYTSKMNSENLQTDRIYISGQDHAELITLTVKQQDFQSLQSLFTSIVNSFQWENK